MTFLYRLIYQFTLLILKVIYPLNQKVKKGYELRKSKDGKQPWLTTRTLTRPIWIHCSSGEFEYAIPLIRTIKNKNPEQKILVTYFTPSYFKRIEQEPLVDLVCPSPWDTPRVLSEFLDFHQPKALLFSRTDIWFEMTEQCKKRNIPIGVFSMTFNKKLSGFKKVFQKWLFKNIDHFFVVSTQDKDLLKTIVDESKISISGDTRYEQCLHRLNLHMPLKINGTALTKKVFIAGSTWPEDEDVLLPFMANNPDLCHWILVPHETTQNHLTSLKEKCLNYRLEPQFYSQTEMWNMQGVLIVDTVGVLAHLYKIADFSFIGGSFKKQVHSVMESLACGCLTYVGPYYKNNREAVEFSEMKAGFPLAAVQVCDSQNFASLFIKNQTLWTHTQSDRLKVLIASKAKVSEPLYKEILEHL